MNLWQPLRLNALLSLTTGALLATAPGAVGDWLGVDIPGWLRLLGFALLGHPAVLWVVSTRDDVATWARVNLAMIAPYPVLMIGLVAVGVIERGTGIALVLLDGATVGVLAFLHWRALRPAASQALAIGA